MAKQKPLVLLARDRQIFEQVQQGWSRQRIAQFHHLTPVRVAQILKNMSGNFTPDENRDWVRAKLEAYLAELDTVIHGKGRLMVASGNGKVVLDEQGNPVYDQYAKAEAVRTALSVLKGLRELDALDRKPPKEEQDGDRDAFDRAMGWVQQLADDKRSLQAKLAGYESGEIVNAEVVEDPAAEDGVIEEDPAGDDPLDDTED
jgi:hypothetical protein